MPKGSYIGGLISSQLALLRGVGALGGRSSGQELGHWGVPLKVTLELLPSSSCLSLCFPATGRKPIPHHDATVSPLVQKQQGQVACFIETPRL